MNILRAIRQRLAAMAREEQSVIQALDSHILALYEGKEYVRWCLQSAGSGFLAEFPYRHDPEGRLITREAYDALDVWDRIPFHDVIWDLSLEQALTICRYICRWNAPWEQGIARRLPEQDRIWYLLSEPSSYHSGEVTCHPGDRHLYLDWCCLGWWEQRSTLPLIPGWNERMEA